MKIDLIGKYKQEPYSLMQKLISESAYCLSKKHYIKGIFEIDITNARKLIKQYRIDTGIKLSFNTYMIKCISLILEMDKSIHALRKNDTLVIFDDVDICLIMEIIVGGKRVPRNWVLRKVNEKNLQQINEEIENAKKVNEEVEKTITDDSSYKTIRRMFLLPKFIRILIWKNISNNPFVIKKMLGTVGFTSVAMFIKTSGWALLTRSFYSLHFILGSVSKKPVFVENNLENHSFISISVLFDHDVIDGAPATRFISKLSALIENGDILKINKV